MRTHWLVAVVVGCGVGVVACEPSEPTNLTKKDAGADVPQDNRIDAGTGGSGSGGSGTGGSGTGGSGSGGSGTGGSGGGAPDVGGNVDAPAGNDADGGANPDAAVDQPAGDDGPGGDAGVDQGMLDDGGFPIGATIGSCASLNWTITASASAAADPPSSAIDGVPVTRWSTGAGQSAGAYYEINFGGYVRLSQLRLDSAGSPGDYPRGFDVLVSADGLDFSTTLVSGAPGDTVPPNNVVTIDFEPRAVRALRVALNTASGSWWSVHELGVTCQIPDGNGGFTTDVVPDNLRCGPGTDGGVPGGAAFNRSLWTLSASSTSTLPGDVIAHAIDGDIVTRWSNGQLQVPGQFFKVDMGAVGCIGQIRMVASALDFVAAYTVSVSVDDVNYIAIAKGVGSNVLQIRLPPHLARYVRIDQTGTSNAWWSIDELTIIP